MNVAIRDRDAMSSLTTWGVRAYLKSRGWMRQDGRRDRAAVYAKQHAGRIWEVLVPLRDTAVDYAESMARCLAVLATVEERSQLSVFGDLSAGSADVIRVRSMNGATRHALSLRLATDLYGNAYGLLVSAARAAERPQATYRGRVSADVREYLDQVVPVDNHSEGYALTLHSPVGPAVGVWQAPETDDVQPFSRLVTSTLAGALESATDVMSKAVAGDAPDIFDTAVRAGVSSNLCESVANLAKSGQGIEISLSWAPSRPAISQSLQWRFTGHSAEVLQEIATSVRRYGPSLDEHIVGPVVNLERKPGQREGHASIMAFRDGRHVRLDVTFDSAAYELVVRAFKDHMPIGLDGDIYRTGSRYEVRNPRNLVPACEFRE